VLKHKWEIDCLLQCTQRNFVVNEPSNLTSELNNWIDAPEPANESSTGGRSYFHVIGAEIRSVRETTRKDHRLHCRFLLPYNTKPSMYLVLPHSVRVGARFANSLMRSPWRRKIYPHCHCLFQLASLVRPVIESHSIQGHRLLLTTFCVDGEKWNGTSSRQ
jgi:hypothetical protein